MTTIRTSMAGYNFVKFQIESLTFVCFFFFLIFSLLCP